MGIIPLRHPSPQNGTIHIHSCGRGYYGHPIFPFMEGGGGGLHLTTLPYITYVTLGDPSRLSELNHTGEMTDLG